MPTKINCEKVNNVIPLGYLFTKMRSIRNVTLEKKKMRKTHEGNSQERTSKANNKYMT